MRSESDLCGRGERSKVGLVVTALQSVLLPFVTWGADHSEPEVVEVKVV